MGLADGQAWERDNPPAEMRPSAKPRLRCPAHGHLASEAEDAARWRALMDCQRIRMMGCTNDLNHIGMEFWSEHPEKHPCHDYPQEGCRERFIAFVDKLRGR